MDQDFIEGLASAAPVPGGGAACAYVGVLATCLTSMVGNLTVGKERYKNIEPAVIEKLQILELQRARLVELIKADEEAFQPLSAAYRMPKDTDEEKIARTQAIQSALYAATEVPLNIMQAIYETLEIARFFAYNGNRTVLSDVGAAANFARAAAHGLSMTVISNIGVMKDEYRARIYRQRMNALLIDIDQRSDFVESYVIDRIS